MKQNKKKEHLQEDFVPVKVVQLPPWAWVVCSSDSAHPTRLRSS